MLSVAVFRLACSLVIAVLAALGNAFAIRGIQAGVNAYTGERPLRQEFSTFKNTGPAFDLYIQALLRSQQADQRQLLSYYEVAGVHGVPFRAWDGVTGKNWAAYCPHGSVLFPTWHRPYMALYEQVIWLNAQWIAAKYPASQRARYRAAALTLRIPYWDWSVNPTMPPEVNQPTIYIKAPNGTINVPNPLYTYTFHPLPSNDDFPPIGSPPNGPKVWSLQSTVRYPDGNNQSQPDLINRQLQANGAALQSMTYTLLTQQPDYGPFSNTRYNDGSGVGRYNNIENIHNAIHMLVGNGGHMSNIPYSSFDPIFWLHHANTDRLFALWQAVYPESNFTSSQVSAYDTLTIDAGQTEDINTPLAPFHSDDSGTLWTSATSWTTKEFGYSYPEINDWAFNSSQLSSNVKTRLNALYNPTKTISKRAVSADTSSSIGLSPNAMNIQWLAKIRISKSDIASPFFVHLYLGQAPADPNSWSFAPNLIASHSVIDTSMLNPASDQAIPTTLYGQIPLNPALLAAGNSNLSSSKMVPLLKSQLSWRLQRTDDVPLDIGEVPSLKVHVVGQQVKPRVREDEFPEYGKAQVYREVTSGKAGGLQEEDDDQD
ncbi:MAG: hypothetical protein L6R36_007696 [Xanthoria steineri]|nr:MAG: hypothetical protein L6R36_007696 [Xanthoria steineri]